MSIMTANGGIMIPEECQQISIGNININALVPAELQESLLSVPQICDQGATVTFTKEKVRIQYSDGKLTDGRRLGNGLYQLPITLANASKTALEKQGFGKALLAMRYESTQERVNVFHAAMGSPSWDTLIHSVEAFNYMHGTGLTAKQVRDHPVNSLATSFGHLDQTHPFHRTEEQKKGGKTSVRSTADKTKPRQQIMVAEWCPRDEWEKKDAEGKVFTDACGEFTHLALDGSKYILVFYNEDRNYIHIETMSSKSQFEYTKAYSRATAFFKSKGCKVLEYLLDNETSANLEAFFNRNDLAWQYFPPHMHRANIAERMIRTFKNHFIATLATVDKSFPMMLWCHILPQIEITLNLMRQGSHPLVSAYEDMMGARYNWERNPMFPLGTKVVTHDKPDKRKTWDHHGQEAFYLGPALDSYRCYRVWTIKTKATRITDTLAWHSDRFKMAAISNDEFLAASFNSMAEALTRIANEPARAKDESFKPATVALLEQMRSYQLLVAPPNNVHRQQIAEQDAATALRIEMELAARKKKEEEDEAKAHTDAAQRVLPDESERADTDYPAGAQRVPVEEPVRADTADAQRVEETNNETQEQAAANEAQRVSEAEEETKRVSDAEKAARQKQLDEQKEKLANEHKETLAKTIEAHKDERTFTFKELTPRHHNTRLGMQPAKNYSKLATEGTTVRFHRAFAAVVKKHEQELEKLESALLFAFSAEYKRALNSIDREHWLKATDEEMVRLVEDTRTMHPVKDEGQTAVYYNPQIKLKEVNGQLVYRVRGTAGGNVHVYHGDTAAACASMPLVKCLLNSVISEHAHDGVTKFCTIDIKDFYLCSTLDTPAFMRIRLDQLSPATIERFKLSSFAKNGKVLFKIVKGIYGLPEAGRLAQKELFAFLRKNGFYNCSNDENGGLLLDGTPCLWHNNPDPAKATLSFSLVVDDFGIKYKEKRDVDALVALLASGGYKTSRDDTGSKYLGFTIDWDYENEHVDLSLPGWTKALAERLELVSTKRTDAPGIYTPPSYGSKKQFSNIDESRQLTAVELLIVQRIVGSLLYYSRAVDPTMLTVCNKISTMEPTQEAYNAAIQLLNYAQTWDDATIRYHASDMVLITYSDGSYLGDSKSRSRQGGIHFLGNRDEPDAINGSVECISSLIRVIVASAAECEYGALYENAVTAEGLRVILHNLGYPQKATNIYCDNSCAVGLANDTVKEKRTKAIDKDFHWVRCRVRQGHFTVQYKKGKENLADIFTKIFPAKEHQRVAPSLVRYARKPRGSDCARTRRTHQRTQHSTAKANGVWGRFSMLA